MNNVHTHRRHTTSTERRHCPRWHSDGTRVHLHVRGESIQEYKVRCMSRVGIFVEIQTAFVPGGRVELAFTCHHTRQLVKMYRRSAYVARTSDDGVALIFSDKHLS
jgi:hypothetical protein